MPNDVQEKSYWNENDCGNSAALYLFFSSSKLPITVVSAQWALFGAFRQISNQWQSNYLWINMSRRLIWQFEIENISIYWINWWIRFIFTWQLNKIACVGGNTSTTVIFIMFNKTIIYSFSKNGPAADSTDCTNLHKFIVEIV